MKKNAGQQSPKRLKNYIIFLVVLMMLGLMYGTIAIASLADSPPQGLNSTYEYPGVSIQFSADTIEPELTGRDYFVNYRLEREKYRREAKEMLAVLLEMGTDHNSEAYEQWLNLSRSIRYEGEIENLLKLRGFADVVSQVNPNHVQVIILASALTPEERKQVSDVVTQITGIKQEDIFISIRN